MLVFADISSKIMHNPRKEMPAKAFLSLAFTEKLKLRKYPKRFKGGLCTKKRVWACT